MYPCKFHATPGRGLKGGNAIAHSRGVGEHSFLRLRAFTGTDNAAVIQYIMMKEVKAPGGQKTAITGRNDIFFSISGGRLPIFLLYNTI